MGNFPTCGGLREMNFKHPTNRMVGTEWDVEMVNHKPKAAFSRSFV